MQYFTDGHLGLVRVDTDAPRRSREFFFASAEKLESDGWHPGAELVLDILNGGYYRPAREEDVRRIEDEIRVLPDDFGRPAPTYSSSSAVVRYPAQLLTASA